RSIAASYRRVTATARPLNPLVVRAMGAALAPTVVQPAGADAPNWVGWTSLGLAGAPIVLAGVRTFPNAVRLARRADPPDVQTRLAWSICRDHLFCAVAITSLLVVQLVFAR